MNDLLRLLLAFLLPQATDPGAEEPAADDAADDSSPDDADDAPDDELAASDPDEPEPAAAAVPARAAPASDDTKEAIRLAREANEAVARLTPRPVDPTYAAEEERLKNPDLSPLEKWQIESNRALRTSQMESRQALFQAQDMADKTGYQAKAISDPVYKKYEAKVEAELAKARAAGANPPREVVLALTLGRDMLAGNFKTKAKASTSIARGKTPGARSDTPARSGLSEHQKRAARLENIQI